MEQKQKPERFEYVNDGWGTGATNGQLAEALSTISAQLDYLIDAVVGEAAATQSARNRIGGR